MSSFYLTLPSNTGDFKDNRHADFRVRLPKHINLEGKWQCSLVEITNPVCSYVLPTAMLWIDREIRGDDTGVGLDDETPLENLEMLDLRSLNYTDIESLADNLVNKIKKEIYKTTENLRNNEKDAYIKDLISFAKDLEIYVDNDAERIVINIPNSIKNVRFSSTLRHTLGFGPSKLEAGRYEARYPPTVGLAVNTLFIYTDIIEPQIVGNKLAPLLRIVPIEGSIGKLAYNSYPNPHYVDLLSNSFDTVRILLKDIAGNILNFEYGQVIVKLHFQKV